MRKKIMNEAKIIKYLYKQIPFFKCKEGCHDCCHDIIVFTSWEWAQIRIKRIATTVKCPYLGESGCEIYEQRPFVCRIYGTTINPKMACPHGCGPAKLLSFKKEIELNLLYRQFLNLDDILSELQKSADLHKIVEDVGQGSEKYTNFVNRLGKRLRERDERKELSSNLSPV